MAVDRNHSNRCKNQPISLEIIKKVSDREGISPVELTPPEYEPLYNTIDPELIEDIVDHGRGPNEVDPTISFNYYRYNITVGRYGIEVNEL
ncbi:HalOD1 output domain-containing protein [Haloterrigena turkmenica]|uniref:HalOD1 output domain-containing protein n=1 Tax=Haloterrigena turkmenica TaxID=62320 RepID=UPI0011D100D8|nr:HalOD1 output domain-containing protein [Haloterrigena turkmenica]